ncbi:uncharacterized protein B0P05DRAFT_568183 [Gilbertella persicaria]|uniref:uncharacterized protein n=1 Tax=Gilbertella persicaria TaxID=101096 RepID=UPI002220DC98|nr:uncharacterized protein B0P05DRAFT_568183 [Gilbertella persicaria]KAI8094967.1 hypothetical protein B0P05DRAFT_568183 [Gilbertella persicaria]
MNEKAPLSLGTGQLLSIAKNDLESLKCYYDHGIPVGYGTKKRYRPNKRLVSFYEESHSRVPDTTEAHLGDKGLKVNRNKNKQEQDQKYFENTKKESQKRSSDSIDADVGETDVSYEDLCNKDDELILGKAIRSEENLMYS